MAENEPEIQPNISHKSGKPPGDVTGRDRMAGNIVANWAGYAVFVAAGFILPRVINGQLGKELLGVWDFAWALVAYFGLVQVGVVSSVNRYVAKYRAAGDVDGVNRSVSSVTSVLLVMGIVILCLTLAATMLIPTFFSERLAKHAADAEQVAGYIADAKRVVLLLGVSLAIETAFAAFGGVLTGCYRYGLHSAIHAGCHAATAVGMIVVLFLEGGLPQLAWVYFFGGLANRVIRCLVAYRVYPQLRIRPAYVDFRLARNMITFGGKSFIPSVADMLLNQTTSVLILAYLGPAALAVYSRPRALVRHVLTLVLKYAHVLTPTASSLHVMGKRDDLQELLTKGIRFAASITLPMTITLVILGGPILKLWMGDDFKEPVLMAVLILGHVASIMQLPMLTVLMGLNAHGRVGIAKLISAICGVVMVVLVLAVLKGSLVGVALAIAIPITIANGIYVPIYTCRRLDMSLRRCITEALQTPVLCSIPFVVSLVAVRFLFADSYVLELIVGAAVGGCILTPLYWRYLLPAGLKQKTARWVAARWVNRAGTAT